MMHTLLGSALIVAALLFIIITLIIMSNISKDVSSFNEGIAKIDKNIEVIGGMIDRYEQNVKAVNKKPALDSKPRSGIE